MRIKNIITALLLLFVAGSVLYSITGKKITTHGGKEGGASKVETKASSHRVVAYYFYGNVRCNTCRKIESYSEEAVKSAFPDELKSGKLTWSAINVDETENEHYSVDYSLSTRSIILSDMVNGKERQWKNLEKIWDLVGDKAAFTSYVQDEIKAYLKE